MGSYLKEYHNNCRNSKTIRTLLCIIFGLMESRDFGIVIYLAHFNSNHALSLKINNSFILFLFVFFFYFDLVILFLCHPFHINNIIFIFLYEYIFNFFFTI